MKSFAVLALAALSQASPVQDTRSLAARSSNGGHAGKIPFQFTSTYEVVASPHEVVDAQNNPTGGLEGCTGLFNYGINVHENVICFNITIDGFEGDYQSPATSATHIHQAPKGKAGPPRIAFPNPVEISEGRRNSIGCLRGPFKTGVVTDGVDSGDGFHVKQIEEDPSAFFTDVHSSLAVPGATRGQLGGPECKVINLGLVKVTLC